MILQALHALAERENLIEDPDFEMKPVRWIVTVTKDGRCAGIADTNWTPEPDAPAKGKKPKKAKPVAKSFAVPRETARTSGDRAFFLVDKSEYAFGREVGGDAKRSTDKLTIRFGMFRDRVAMAAKETGDEGLSALEAMLGRVASGEIEPKIADDAVGNDLFAFVYAPDIDVPMHQRPKVVAWWKGQRGEIAGAADTRQCLVTGKQAPLARLYPGIKRVPGGSTSGVGLVSFNSAAFESYGWSGGENAPISQEAAESSSTALNRLVHNAYPNPADPNMALKRRNLYLSRDTALCFWSKEAEGEEFCDALPGVFEASDADVPELYKSLWSGKPPETDAKMKDFSPFYGLVITGTTGRAILRDWFETPIADAQENLRRHFEDIAIVRNAPWKKDEEPPQTTPLRYMLEALAPGGDQAGVPNALAAQLVRAALKGTPYPFGLLVRAVERARAEIGRDDWTDLQRRDARAAIIKAVLNRNGLSERKLERDMDPMNTNTGYNLGCLMAVLERLQQEALHDVNASVVDKYFSGASAAPRATFDRLVKNARHHAKKAPDGKNDGFVFNLERLIDQLMLAIDVKEEKGKPTGFPLTLPLDQQGLFVIGYHHMRHWLWMSREERESWEGRHPDAPRAYQWASRKAKKGAELEASAD